MNIKRPKLLFFFFFSQRRKTAKIRLKCAKNLTISIQCSINLPMISWLLSIAFFFFVSFSFLVLFSLLTQLLLLASSEFPTQIKGGTEHSDALSRNWNLFWNGGSLRLSVNKSITWLSRCCSNWKALCRWWVLGWLNRTTKISSAAATNKWPQTSKRDCDFLGFLGTGGQEYQMCLTGAWHQTSVNGSQASPSLQV